MPKAHNAIQKVMGYKLQSASIRNKAFGSIQEKKWKRLENSLFIIDI
jgi:hypothetical protein